MPSYPEKQKPYSQTESPWINLESEARNARNGAINWVFRKIHESGHFDLNDIRKVPEGFLVAGTCTMLSSYVAVFIKTVAPDVGVNLYTTDDPVCHGRHCQGQRGHTILGLLQPANGLIQPKWWAYDPSYAQVLGTATKNDAIFGPAKSEKMLFEALADSYQNGHGPSTWKDNGGFYLRRFPQGYLYELYAIIHYNVAEYFGNSTGRPES